MSAPMYAWAVLNSLGGPPTGSLLHSRKTGYHFYPLRHEGQILSVDVALWKAATNSSASRVVHWPEREQLEDELATKPKGQWTLIAVVASPRAATIDSSTDVDLQSLREIPIGFRSAGFDVIDRAGLSALGNIGFSDKDMAEIDRLSLIATESGLIRDSQRAQEFADVASRLAAEHAPFFPTLILARQANS